MNHRPGFTANLPEQGPTTQGSFVRSGTPIGVEPPGRSSTRKTVNRETRSPAWESILPEPRSPSFEG